MRNYKKKKRKNTSGSRKQTNLPRTMLGGGFPLLIRISGSEGGKKEIGPQKQAQILFKYQVLI